jgi:hypothetical protein
LFHISTADRGLWWTILQWLHCKQLQLEINFYDWGAGITGDDEQSGKIQLRQDLFVDMNIGRSCLLVLAGAPVRFTSPPLFSRCCWSLVADVSRGGATVGRWAGGVWLEPVWRAGEGTGTGKWIERCLWGKWKMGTIRKSHFDNLMLIEFLFSCTWIRLILLLF